jgi:hypothetical protein
MEASEFTPTMRMAKAPHRGQAFSRSYADPVQNAKIVLASLAQLTNYYNLSWTFKHDFLKAQQVMISSANVLTGARPRRFTLVPSQLSRGGISFAEG